MGATPPASQPGPSPVLLPLAALRDAGRAAPHAPDGLQSTTKRNPLDSILSFLRIYHI